MASVVCPGCHEDIDLQGCEYDLLGTVITCPHCGFKGELQGDSYPCEDEAGNIVDSYFGFTLEPLDGD
jgi:DNA-directed RNA polymerase subunit RPC12/RpoP